MNKIRDLTLQGGKSGPHSAKLNYCHGRVEGLQSVLSNMNNTVYAFFDWLTKFIAYNIHVCVEGKMSISKTTIAFPSAIVAAVIIIAMGGGVFQTINGQMMMMTGTTMSTEVVVVQKTAMSTVDSLPGHEHEQAVIVLPARNDSKIWASTISWTSSKPVELRLLFDYNSTIVPDVTHSKPLTAPFGKGDVAIGLIKPLNSGAESAGFNSYSMNFVAKQVAFHTIDGTPFTVTYAVDAAAK